jgi:anti-sigma regulatory factor (Ser/Thr protein kinase)
MKRRLAFPSDTCHLSTVRGQTRKFLAENGLDECAAEMLVLAIDEACTNIIRYAYEYERKPVRMDMERLNDRVRFVLRDYGRKCDPAVIRSRALEDIRPGGVGVHIIRHVFDRVEYQPCLKGTKLILEKILSPVPHGSTDAGATQKS